jgi:hypothetical protein
VKFPAIRLGNDRLAEREANTASVGVRFEHSYHERVISDILVRARGYQHRTRRYAVEPGSGDGAVSKGDLIRARIASNAQKRFEIAEAMKAEAGVADHQLTGELSGGIAWTDRARILAPAGENRVQLATLAHECGHVFLHGIGTEGYNLPGHVKEMEAESYAHQAFVAHGMRMPAGITAWGRRYVGEWIAADRASGIPIDPQAVAYAAGLRSPYEPLRYIPASWARTGNPARLLPAWAFSRTRHVKKPRRAWRNLPVFRNHHVREAGVLTGSLLKSLVFGSFIAHLALKSERVREDLALPPRRSEIPSIDDALLIGAFGIICACVVVSLRIALSPSRRTRGQDAG